MGILHTVERRREPRTAIDIGVMVWGVDTRGEHFIQTAHAHDISLSGAMVKDLAGEVRPGDVVGILYQGKKARFRVVWVRYDRAGEETQAALRRMEADECPWLELLLEETANVAVTVEETKELDSVSESVSH